MPTVIDKNYATYFKDVSVSRSLVAGSDGSADPLIAGTPGFVIVIRRIAVIATTSAAASYTFRTNNATPVVLFTVPASAVAGPYGADYMHALSEGYVLPAGADLDLAMSGAGPAGIVRVEAHKRLADNTPISAAAWCAAAY